MPIYEYLCQSCHHELEALQKMSDSPLVDCPACQQPSLKKRISAAGFRLSGSGWYETDFKSGSKKNLAGEKATKESAKSESSAGKASSDKASTSSTKA